MREEDSNWFSKWADELPSPEELTPLSQTLISTDLAAAFNIQTSGHRSSGTGDPDSSSADEPARTLKRPRLVWTPQLHKRFVDAVAHLGIKNAVPKTIMQLMSVDGLTRENVASHLQKYRLYLKRMQGIHTGSGSGSGDSATDHLFASSPVPAHFLNGGGRSNSQRLMGYSPPAAMVVAPYHHQYHQHRQMGQIEHPFLSRQAQMGGARLGFQNSAAVDSGSPAGGKKALTLFPNGDI